MLKKVSFFCLLAVFAYSANAVAQSNDAMIASIAKYNDNVNADIAAEKLFSHRVTLNTESSKTRLWGKISKYQENLTCYFEVRDGLTILKKIIILSDIADRQSYTDMLFDESGNPALVFYTNNLKNASSANDRYMYSNRKLIYFSTTKNTELGAVTDSYDESNFETKQINDGLEMMTKAENYKKMFDAIAKVQMSQF
ncbi:hypothetical protein C7N43_22370 [Sphingobacteriales bacterium UPWRP_1]|nr:hypothetical protein B6N25_07585 [Sphingobacteriales bacterium TSM_CSS]PSJ74763.1 hypothetical protein C7N43_22370 [Sphingobacteriales bacterium UPWRP_1]